MIFATVAILVLVVLLLGDAFLHWPGWVLPAGVGLASVGNFVMVMTAKDQRSRHG